MMRFSQPLKHFLSPTMLGRAMKRINPSADRNSQPISEALLLQVDRKTPEMRLLEIASGCGQHAGFLAPLIPNVIYQPTEYSLEDFGSIAAYVADCPTGNIRSPLFVDVSQELQQWQAKTLEQVKVASYDYMLNCNMMHISPWACSEGLFRAAGQLLKAGGKLFTYGPYAQDGQLTPQSNVDFDASLRQSCPAWGIRDISNLKVLAQQNGLQLELITNMPANNKFLTWLKISK